MKRSLLHLIAVAAVSLLAASPSSWAQTAATKRLDVFLLENKFVTVDRPIVSVSSSKPEAVMVKQAGAENQFEVRGLLLGEAIITVVTQEQRLVQGRPEIVEQELLFYVTVSPAPSRIYINVPESKRLSFKDPIIEASFSRRGIVRIVQPGGAERVLLLEAQAVGQTTVTVLTGEGDNVEVYRYYISTFDNRGADVLDIQNEFARKGYRFLTVTFTGDQAILSGTVPTQEELDDAVRIVKQYTPYVVIRAVVGTTSVQLGESEQERTIINAIKTLARSPNVIIRVKFAETPPNAETTAPGTGTGDTTADPDDADSQGAEAAVDQPDADEVENIERIFLFGEVESDLEESRVIRVARTYTDEVFSFIKVKDPIQLRFHIRVVEVSQNARQNLGLRLATTDGSGTVASAQANLNTGASTGVDNIILDFTRLMAQNFTLAFQTNMTYSLQLLKELDLGSVLQYTHLFVTNDQPGTFFSGDQIPYEETTAIGAGGVTTSAIGFLSVGLTVVTAPLNATQANYGNTAPVVQSANTTGVGGTPTTLPTYLRFPEPVAGVGAVEEHNKYVDENGMISVFVGVTTSTPGATPTIISGNPVPTISEQTTSARAYLRENESVVLTGLFSDSQTVVKEDFPFLSDIPVFGWLFRQRDRSQDRSELFVVVSPEIIRFQDSDDKRLQKPEMPEMADQLTRLGFVPTMEPVRYHATGTDLRGVTENKEGEYDPQPLFDETRNIDLTFPTLNHTELPVDTGSGGKDSKGTPLPAEIPAITDTLP